MRKAICQSQFMTFGTNSQQVSHVATLMTLLPRRFRFFLVELANAGGSHVLSCLSSLPANRVDTSPVAFLAIQIWVQRKAIIKPVRLEAAFETVEQGRFFITYWTVVASISLLILGGRLCAEGRRSASGEIGYPLCYLLSTMAFGGSTHQPN
jgi:hypothetical protein